MNADAELPHTVGVVGAGTMGAGIAQLAASAGFETLLYDAQPDALERRRNRIKGALERQAEKGRITAQSVTAALGRLRLVSTVKQLAECDFVVEAAPEQLELKLELFRSLAAVVGDDCVLATNTSSLAVTEIAASTPHPDRVVGMHFFNPAPVMRLVEVIPGQATAATALAVTRGVGEAMGKQVITAADIPGFIVNRCNRPYSLEALRVLEANVASVEQIDRIARLAGGFRMGPFELMDLVGLETNHAVAEAFYRQTFGEPRFRPSLLQARMIQAGRLGRKTGAGWYEYPARANRARSESAPAKPGGGDGRTVRVIGSLPVADAVRRRLREAAFTLVEGDGQDTPWLTLSCDGTVVSGPRAQLLFGGSLHGCDPEAAGFHLLPPLDAVRLIEVTKTTNTDATAYSRLQELIGCLGCVAEPVRDTPGLVIGRIVCQLINEAAFLIGAGDATPADVDAGLELGVNHPRGPGAWSEQIGLGHVVSVLDGLYRELGEERYRVAPLLRQAAVTGGRLSTTDDEDRDDH